jgi:hypothetical protein
VSDQAVDDDRFMENVREARDNGYDRVCAACGVGVYDESDIHERSCPEFVETGH